VPVGHSRLSSREKRRSPKVTTKATEAAPTIHCAVVLKTDNSLLLRTDFSDEAAWASLCEALRQPSGEGFSAFLACASDRAYDGLSVEQLVAMTREGGDRSFVFIADRATLSAPEQPVLVVDLHQEPGRTFRAIPREMWSVENNLSIANMDFSEFADNVDPDGIFRGFPQP